MGFPRTPGTPASAGMPAGGQWSWFGWRSPSRSPVAAGRRSMPTSRPARPTPNCARSGSSPIPERIGQRLEIALRNSLNPDGEPTPQRYRLRHPAARYAVDLGIQSTRAWHPRQARCLRDLLRCVDMQERARRCSPTRCTSPNRSTSSPTSTRTSSPRRMPASARVEELRREIVTRLTLFLQRRAAEKSAKPG